MSPMAARARPVDLPACDELLSILGSIRVILGLIVKTDGSAARALGKIGDPGDDGVKIATDVFDPSRWRALEVARVGMRS